jgi:hypothetical protein
MSRQLIAADTRSSIKARGESGGGYPPGGWVPLPPRVDP